MGQDRSPPPHSRCKQIVAAPRPAKIRFKILWRLPVGMWSKQVKIRNIHARLPSKSGGKRENPNIGAVGQ
jgi:hypothetical protein